jgi:hypothetical protein
LGDGAQEFGPVREVVIYGALGHACLCGDGLYRYQTAAGPRQEARGGVDKAISRGLVRGRGRVQTLSRERGPQALEPAEVVVNRLARNARLGRYSLDGECGWVGGESAACGCEDGGAGAATV